MRKQAFILLFQCADQPGIVARVTDFIFRRGGNILDAQQHTTDPQGGYFFLRVEFILQGDSLNEADLSQDLHKISRELDAAFQIYAKDSLPRAGIMVSKPDHCLYELLYLWQSGELNAKISFVASNFSGHKKLVESYDLPFHFIPATALERKEKEFLALAGEQSDFLVLARYMLKLSAEFLAGYNKDIINIHHGFLPSFKGSGPYRQAFEQGVKVIGATAHFVTEKLDEGPIISQRVEEVTHRDDVASLTRKGKNLEKHALSDAVMAYLDHRVIRHGNKTVVFEGK